MPLLKMEEKASSLQLNYMPYMLSLDCVDHLVRPSDEAVKAALDCVEVMAVGQMQTMVAHFWQKKNPFFGSFWAK